MTNIVDFGRFYLTIAGYEPTKNLIYSVRNIFRPVLGTPTIWERRYKVPL